MALDICGNLEQKVKVTGRDTGATAQEFTSYLLQWIDKPELKSQWQNLQRED